MELPLEEIPTHRLHLFEVAAALEAKEAGGCPCRHVKITLRMEDSE
jgi:hypothetical protein